VTPTKPGSASLPFFGIEPAIIDPVSGEEIHGNDVEGVLAFKQAWPSMARTVWGAHKRYMDTYLNVYKGYYVSCLPRNLRSLNANFQNSSLVMVPAVTTKASTGSVAESTTWSTSAATVSQQPRSKPH
jgi:acetyl-CoA synthetase